MPAKPTVRALRPGIRFLEGVLYYSKGIYRYVDAHPIYLVSAGIAFNVLLCVVPLMFLLVYGLGHVIEWQSVLGVIDQQLSQIIPELSYRTTIMNVLRDQADAILDRGRIAGLTGLVGAIWASSALFSSARTALNGIYEVRSRKFFVLNKLYDVLLLLMLGVLVVISNIAVPLTALLHEIGTSFIPVTIESLLEYFATWAVGIASTMLLFVLLYRYLSHVPVPFKSTLVGAITATVLMECAKLGFTYYLLRFPMLGLFYGTYTFLVVTALWFYFSALVFIIGGILTKLHWDRGRVEKTAMKASGTRRNRSA